MAVTTTAPSPLRILVVASDPELLMSTSATLREAGHEVVPAEDGMAALRLAASLPNVIIVDERLTDLSGSDVCRRLKMIPATALIPVLQLASSDTTDEGNASGLDASADGRLEHPLDPATLLAAVITLAAHERLSQVDVFAPPGQPGAGPLGGLG